MDRYYSYQKPMPRRQKRRGFRPRLALYLVIGLVVAGAAYKLLAPTPVERAISQLHFDESVGEAEKQTIKDSIQAQSKSYDGSTIVRVNTALDSSNSSLVLSAYVPITNLYAPRQTVTKEELKLASIRISSGADTGTRNAIMNLFELSEDKISTFDNSKDELGDDDIAFVPADQLSSKVKLLRLDDGYYLDDFQKGAIFRQTEFTGDAAQSLSDLKLNSLPTKNEVLKVNQTGVTALTRLMMRKLSSVKNPLYFSEKIGAFLADADITHVSNEVSFKAGCSYSDTLFCSPPEMIEVLKASGVDIVEITGNHNNDVGAQFNTETIDLYHSLGWKTIGGGLNTAEAAKFYVADQKGSKIAFLAYNYPDSPNGGAIAGSAKAGANSFDYDRIKTDIESAKQQASFVIVDIQFWECYAYPDGYVEFPQCDGPIPTQAEVFGKVVDLGANMVVGTSAHQPQTYEKHNDAMIYYGLGNLYFDQDRWPGTERGIILTHYFQAGKLLQTKLSPTVYHSEYQTRLMGDEDAVKLLGRLDRAR